MIIINVKENETVDRALKRFKKKFEKTGVLKELRARKKYEKPSVQKRDMLIKAKYKEKMIRENGGF
ncbi:MAG: 30S ribosomal protein S21 [Cyclobacteriaceae bacterium]